jgi:ribosomal protein S1
LQNKTPIEAEVFKITPHGIFVNIFGNKIQAKLPIAKNQNLTITPEVKVGDRIQIIVTYLGSSKIIIERA